MSCFRSLATLAPAHPRALGAATDRKPVGPEEAGQSPAYPEPFLRQHRRQSSVAQCAGACPILEEDDSRVTVIGCAEIPPPITVFTSVVFSAISGPPRCFTLDRTAYTFNPALEAEYLQCLYSGYVDGLIASPARQRLPT
jgi:hypothetical protein